MNNRTTFHIRGDNSRGDMSQSVFDVNVSFAVAIERYDPFQHAHSGDWRAMPSLDDAARTYDTLQAAGYVAVTN
jgi:hypothetical protein